MKELTARVYNNGVITYLIMVTYLIMITISIFVEGLAAQVYQAGRSMNLVYLDCGTNMACDFDRVSKLHPLFIYIKISRQEVCSSYSCDVHSAITIIIL